MSSLAEPFFTPASSLARLRWPAQRRSALLTEMNRKREASTNSRNSRRMIERVTPSSATVQTQKGNPVLLRDLAMLFLKLGAIAFGGPAAHIAMMDNEVVRRRQWLSREEFLDLLAASNLIPGPNSTELAIHIGHRRARWAGLVVAGACFILP